MIPKSMVGKSWLIAILVAAAQASSGCGSSSTKADGGGGAGGRGGSGGSGGSGGAGGGASDAGRGGSGGAGNANDAGDAGDAGPSACASAPYSHVSAFGAIFDGWGVAFNSTAELVPMPGVGPDGGFSGTVQEIDSADGSPVNGSVKLSVPFSDRNQDLLFAHAYNGGVNMSGAVVSAQIKLDSGLISAPTDLAQAFFVLKSTSGYLYAPGPDIALDPSAGWVTISASVNAPSASIPTGYTPCDIREIDLVIHTGNTGSYRPAVIHIDTITIAAPGSTPDAGTESDAGPPDGSAGPDAGGAPDAGSGG